MCLDAFRLGISCTVHTFQLASSSYCIKAINSRRVSFGNVFRLLSIQAPTVESLLKYHLVWPLAHSVLFAETREVGPNESLKSCLCLQHWLTGLGFASSQRIDIACHGAGWHEFSGWKQEREWCDKTGISFPQNPQPEFWTTILYALRRFTGAAVLWIKPECFSILHGNCCFGTVYKV